MFDEDVKLKTRKVKTSREEQHTHKEAEEEVTKKKKEHWKFLVLM